MALCNQSDQCNWVAHGGRKDPNSSDGIRDYAFCHLTQTCDGVGNPNFNLFEKVCEVFPENHPDYQYYMDGGVYPRPTTLSPTKKPTEEPTAEPTEVPECEEYEMIFVQSEVNECDWKGRDKP